MKIRLENQEIRFRLSKEEKAILSAGNMLSVHIIYGQGILNSHSYILMVSNMFETITLEITNGIFEVFIPEDYIHRWTDDKIGFEESISIKEAADLKIIVEIDLKRNKSQQ